MINMLSQIRFSDQQVFLFVGVYLSVLIICLNLNLKNVRRLLIFSILNLFFYLIFTAHNVLVQSSNHVPNSLNGYLLGAVLSVILCYFIDKRIP